MTNQRSPITSHVLNLALGKPAHNLKMTLEILKEGVWSELSRGVTDKDGRVENLLTPGDLLASGQYRLTFFTEDYFTSIKFLSFYPSVCVAFNVVNPQEHYHIPLLLNNFGYSTYRGS